MEYLSGGLLGNTPLLFLIFFLSFLDPSFLNTILLAVNIAILGSVVGGAALAAFYVAVGVQSRRVERVVTVGLVTGGFSYLINLALSLLLIPFPPGDYVKIVAFLSGGALGAFVRTKRKRTVRRPPPSSQL